MGLNRPPANAFRRAARAAVALLPAVVLLAPSGGANGADKRETAQVQLEQLSAQAKETLARQAQLQSTAEEIKADRTELKRRLIETAERIKESEAQIEEAEAKLARLGDRERILRASLKARRESLADVLAALQRLGRTPPPALMVRPQDALEAIRSAILMGAIVPELRVEAQVFVLVNDPNALDFGKLAEHGQKNGLHQALNIPADTGRPVQYAGSTTGPSYNEVGSPFQVSWSVRPKVAKVNIASVGEWCKGNAFDEDHAHGVRNLVTNLELLAPIAR